MKKCVEGSGFPVSGAARERLERDFFSAARRSCQGRCRGETDRTEVGKSDPSPAQDIHRNGD